MSARFEIKDSPIHGKGVFTTAFVKKNTKLGYYKGKLLTKEEVGEGGGDYVLQLIQRPPWISKAEWNSGKKYVDAEHNYECLSRYVNGCKHHKKRQNCRIGESGMFTITKNLKKGTEVLTDYGSDYWD